MKTANSESRVNIPDEAWISPDSNESTAQRGQCCGDVPISQAHILKADSIFPPLMEMLRPLLRADSAGRAVIGICGGSGSGKSGTAAVIAQRLLSAGIGTHVISGDNYPHRIPLYNDAERLRVFRFGGIHALIKRNMYSEQAGQFLMDLQARDQDFSPSGEHPWLSQYISGGKEALAAYLGTSGEIDFDELNALTERFKSGADTILLKHMGRDPASIFYERLPLFGIRVLIIEWTHANSPYLRGIDIPVFLMSTPQETLGHRLARNRDAAIDSPFTSLVLDIEQGQLLGQLPKAKIVISFEGQRVDGGGGRAI